MKIAYERTPQHWAEANIAYLENTEYGKKRLRQMRWFNGGIAAVVSVLIFLAFTALIEVPLSRRILGAPVCLALSIAMARYLTPRIARREINQYVRKAFHQGKNRDFLGQRVLTLEAEGVRVRGESAEELHFWKRVKDVVVAERYILLCIGGNQLMELPKEVFATPQHQAEFLATVERFRQGQVSQTQAWYQSKELVG